ncbi:aminodeoxychorismate/anthranilate synthase component II [Barnesiella sp. WM24]|uniref:anthranilate synthase component II n=1 Tax=Barnesiella sp. WM24 TaxID=2558278 RepID=UPI001071DE04|nr:aminodeoxychorismate/anthranilate synthase component II [Barnesiella sp. WM24]TFU94057.1 aminodeoxychorismate/anthranilate synthase component II [Barnesiella sp. WM24]
MRLLILDNYDSFTYNIVHAARQLGFTPEVYRNDEISIDDIDRYDKIILSPGPGIPEEAGIMPDLIKRYADTKSILGICLGEQAIGECFGAKLRNLADVYHGIQSEITVIGDDYIFSGLPERIKVGRYHSWVVDGNSLPDTLEVTAVSDDGEIMAIRHKTLDVRGVQFHPESVLTPEGTKILSNWLSK